jgi:hypothetical protein
MSSIDQSVDAGLAEVCDLVLPLEIPLANVSIDDILSVLGEMLSKQQREQTMIAHVATLSSTEGKVGSSSSSSPRELTFVVLHVSNPSAALLIMSTIQHLQSLSSNFAFLGRAGWLHRSVVEEHCDACSTSSSVLIDPPVTKLEVLLSARRCQLSRKRPLEIAAEVGDEDDLSCIVMYLSNQSKQSPDAGGSDRTMQLLAVMERTASEARWPILEHYLDRVKHRFFLRCPSSSDAAKVREQFIALAKSGTEPLLQGDVTTTSMKVCSLDDMRRASASVI